MPVELILIAPDGSLWFLKLLSGLCTPEKQIGDADAKGFSAGKVVTTFPIHNR
jgi:hypothetical protein